MLFAALGCNTPAPLIDQDILLPLAPRAAVQPSDGDLATRDLARAALLGDHEAMDRALATLERIAGGGGEAERQLDRRIPMSLDLRNATLDDPVAYREACKSLHGRKHNDPRLESRLEECVEDDPLRLAQRRVLDNRETLWAETYNAVAEPLSRSIISGGILTPYYIANSVASYLARMNEREAFPVQLRQALAHRERFLAHFPDSEEAPEIRTRVAKARNKLHKEDAKKFAFRSNVARKNGNLRASRVLAQRALENDPNNRKARRLAEQASRLIETERRERRRSEDVAFEAASVENATHATALLLAGRDLGEHGLLLLRSDQYQDVGRYVVATALAERGEENAAWDRLRDLAGEDPRKTTMARHARALVRDPLQNPYGSFERVRGIQRGKEVSWHLFGGFFQGPRYRRLPQPIAWLVDLPLLVNTFIFSPIRFIFSPISEKPDFDRPVAIAAYRYLDREPEGQHKDQLSRLLFDYESDRKNWSAALRMADHVPFFDAEERRELVEKAAEQRIAVADQSKRRDRKSSTLRSAAREFPDSEGGRLAGIAAREHREKATAQNIRMTRGFLVENPQVAGSRALGIRPELIDGNNANGELHPRGVSFIGGRYLEFEFLDESGDEDELPNRVRQKISQERLTRLVAILDDTARRNYRVDPDVDVAADPRRDLFIERARLGLTEEPDPRATARSTYVFQSARERFGMVRGRESLLPFDLVVRGDLTSAGIAAFPRWRKPRETPDAFLYR
ncbi:MAG: hypothetical protein GY944_01110 [bacterium]|nr:hypothetical protein [bacterium]